MLAYVVHRLLLMIPTLLGVAVLVFLLLRVMPGDVVELKLKADGADVSAETLKAERQRLGLDKPMASQLADWLTGLATLDFGTSMWTEDRVSHEVAIRLQLSIEVAILAALVAVAIGIPFGILAALYRNTWIDQAIRIVAFAGLATPSFWLGMLVILGLLALFEWSPPVTFTPFFQDPVANLMQLIWPALAVGYRYSAMVTRMTRSTLLEVLQEDYIRTARAKGVSERMVVLRHAMRNAMLPVITVVGLEFAFLIGGLVVTEQVFNLNGIGKLFVDATLHADYTMVQALVMLVAGFFILVNFCVDMLYAVLDPRVRYR